ncbi:1-acyl-sn-glycerol-3-phosphate acyltransferase [Caloramator quimbayensis]|uniref:1-acyl-sn-glycerol-3-phosphate acyltransferase n=1 Tax=Caloramator quimbayensis TaxID=1147123 RepID=A0A1T4X0R1_9CLOT|nr:lysophospholipid acyltransferase family protein [Caloramator quimbayensis]SKA83192.1 1-acyl-sn-glycerol-3-phosphate acyltransferase [Caloramator quimbayensis]
MIFYNFAKYLMWILFHLIYRVEVVGTENIPKDEGVIICPNHFAFGDPVVVGITCPRQVRYMAKKELFKNPFVRIILKGLGAYPVKRGEADLNAIKMTLKLLKDKKIVGLFPEGTRVKTGKFGQANPGVAMLSIKSGKAVIPTLITGSYRLFSKIKVQYGQPIDFTKYKKEKMTNDDYFELSQMVIQKLYELKGE